MSVQDAGVAKGLDRGLSFPSNALSEVPFRVYTDPEQYRLEQERIFKGPTWSYLCLAAEIPEPGDWVATTIAGETGRAHAWTPAPRTPTSPPSPRTKPNAVDMGIA